MASGLKASSFVRQASILAGASLFVRLLGFAYRIPLTNFIGDEGNAYYTVAYSVYTFAMAVSSGAFIAAVSKLTSERIALGQFRNAHELFKTAMRLAMGLGFVAALIMFFGARIIAEQLNLPEAFYAIRALAPAVFLVSMLAVLRGYFQGMKTTIPTATSQMVEQVFKVAFSVLLAFIFLDAASVERSAAGASAGTVVSVLSALGVVGFLYSVIAKDLKRRADADTKRRTFESRKYQISVLFRTALPIIVGLAIAAVGNMIDTSMAMSRITAYGAFTEDEATILVGQFTGKFILLTTLPVSLSLALSSAVIPEISSSAVTKDYDGVRHKTNMAMRLSMVISIPAVVGLSVLSDPIVALLFPRHPGGGELLRYGAISIIFLALVQILTGVMQGIGQVVIPVIGMIFGVVVKIPINYVLMSIPSINILGAVISTIVCFAVATGLNFYFLYRITGILPEVGSMFIKPGIAAAGMGLVCYAIYYTTAIFMPNALATLIALAAGGLAYIVLMVLIKGFRQKDLEALPLPRKLRRMISV